MTRIFLLGYMGVGKTSVGKELARVLNISFIDLDLFIENRYHRTVSKLFEEYGEDGFRKIEKTLLREVSDFEDLIISTGGGAPCFFDNMEYMNAHGTTIYLKSFPEVLAKRLFLCKDARPLLKDKTESELFDFVNSNLKLREPFYNKAQFVFETEEFSEIYKTEQSVTRMIDLLKLKIKK